MPRTVTDSSVVLSDSQNALAITAAVDSTTLAAGAATARTFYLDYHTHILTILVFNFDCRGISTLQNSPTPTPFIMISANHSI